MKQKLDKLWMQWLSRKHPATKNPRLNRHKIYVLPSKFGGLFLIVILSIFIGSINYQLSSGFFLTFLLLTIVMLSAWTGHQNLNNTSFTIHPIPDTCTHRNCLIPINITYKDAVCYDLAMFIDQHKQIWDRIESGHTIHLSHTFIRRGYHPVPRIRIETRYPFGLFVIWSYLTFDAHVYVYPKPKAPGFWPNPCSAINNASINLGDDEFYALNQSDNPWKQPSRISWKTAAKGYGWYEKQYSSSSQALYYFSVNQVDRFPLEEGLKYICFWLIESEKRGYEYAFEYQKDVNAKHGEDHLKQQLRHVALYGNNPS